MEHAKEVCFLTDDNGETADAVLSALDQLLTASGEGLVAFDESDNVIFSTRFAEQVLDIRTSSNAARMSAQLLTLKEARPVRFSELAEKLPATIAVKTTSGERLISVRGVPERRVFMLRDAGTETNPSHGEHSLLDIVAHDLRGGMVPAKTYSQMLLSSVFGALNDKQTDAARVIDASLAKQEDRIASVLDMVKASENRLEIQPETISLIDVVRQAIALTERDARRKGVEMTRDLDESAALVVADARRLQRVIVNLLARSLKHSTQGQTLGIEVRYMSQKRARLRIWDAGVGSSAGDLEILQKLTGERSPQQPIDKHSANIDIAAIADILRAQNFELTVQTEPGAGTTYLLYFPVQRKAGASAAGSGKETPLLIAGADPAEREILENAAKAKNLAIVFAENGKEAIRLSRARHFPLAILNERFADCDQSAVVAAMRFQRPEEPQALCIIRHDGQTVNDAGVKNWRGVPNADVGGAELVLSSMLKTVMP